MYEDPQKVVLEQLGQDGIGATADAVLLLTGRRRTRLRKRRRKTVRTLILETERSERCQAASSEEQAPDLPMEGDCSNRSSRTSGARN